MREAYEYRLPHLVEALEPLRERTTVQQELALDDMERRRYVAPRRAERERRREAATRPAE